MYVEGTTVIYRKIIGTISFVSNKYLTILIKQGKHRSQDVKLVVFNADFHQIEIIGEK